MGLVCKGCGTALLKVHAACPKCGQATTYAKPIGRLHAPPPSVQRRIGRRGRGWWDNEPTPRWIFWLFGGALALMAAARLGLLR